MDYKREREQLNLTAREVAKAAGISLRRYLLIEDEKINGYEEERGGIRYAIDRAKKQALAKLEHWNRLNREE